MYWKYGISIIVIKLYSVESNRWNHHALHNYDVINQQNNETCDLQYTNSKLIIKKTIITKRMSIHYSMNIFKSRIFYPYKHNNLTY